MSNCNCEPKKYEISLGCCQPVLGDIRNYYTKWQIDRMIESATTSGCCITPEEVDDKISSAKTEIENEIPSLSGYATEQWVEDKHYITGVDLSDYALKSEIPTIPTNVSAFVNDAGYLTEHQSLEDYATTAYVNTQISSQTGDFVTGEELSSFTYDKSTIDSKIAQGGTFDPSLYYDKAATDALLADKLDASAYTPCDLSDYVTFENMAEYVGDVYTKTEVNNLFVTKATFNTYITNLQEQINSLIEAISGCCGSTGETEYRWITMTNDYACSGTTKMTKEKQQSSTDGGMTWTDTGQYRTGSTVIQYNSTDCGYAPSSNYKVRVVYKKDSPVESGQVECNSSTTLTNDELKEQITFPAYFTSVEFGSCIDTIGEDAFINAGALTTVTVPSNIKTLESCAFANCSTSSYTLSEGLVTIGTTAFVNNNNLTSITIPNSVKTIDGSAFSNCANLETVTIGSGVTFIGSGAFAVATSSNVKIQSVTINATTPPALDGGTATFVGNYPIYVPAQSVDVYKSAQYWSNLWADRIQAIP